jgi:hypothetical protein
MTYRDAIQEVIILLACPTKGIKLVENIATKYKCIRKSL